MKDSEVYLRAAELIAERDTPEYLSGDAAFGCCGAIATACSLTDVGVKYFRLKDLFAQHFMPKRPGMYWWASYGDNDQQARHGRNQRLGGQMSKGTDTPAVEGATPVPKHIEARVAGKAAKWDRAEKAFQKALGGCMRCDHEKSNGELVCHCKGCQFKVTELAWRVFVLGENP